MHNVQPAHTSTCGGVIFFALPPLPQASPPSPPPPAASAPCLSASVSSVSSRTHSVCIHSPPAPSSASLSLATRITQAYHVEPNRLQKNSSSYCLYVRSKIRSALCGQETGSKLQDIFTRAYYYDPTKSSSGTCDFNAQKNTARSGWVIASV